MHKRRIAVLYTHTLFGLGIAHLLRADEQMDVTCLRADRATTAEELKRLRPYAIVVEGREENPLLAGIVQDMPAALFIGVHPEDNSMVIYHGRQVVTGCPESLLEAIRHGPCGPVGRSSQAN